MVDPAAVNLEMVDLKGEKENSVKVVGSAAVSVEVVQWSLW